jgi:hypothetical protein
MLDLRISAQSAVDDGLHQSFDDVRALLTSLENLALASTLHAASQQEFSAPAPSSLATRYAAANSLSRRRFDAVLRDAETVAHVGVALIIGRADRQDRSTATAARFLGKSLMASLRKLDDLLGPQIA